MDDFNLLKPASKENKRQNKIIGILIVCAIILFCFYFSNAIQKTNHQHTDKEIKLQNEIKLLNEKIVALHSKITPKKTIAKKDPLTSLQEMNEKIRLEEALLKWQDVQLSLEKLTTASFSLNYAKVNELAELFQDTRMSLLSKRGMVRFDKRTNKIWVQDIPKNIDVIGALIKQLDVPVQQVLIEAKLASVDYDCERELGVQFATVDPNTPKKNLEQLPGHYSLAVAKLADGSRLDVKLVALEKAGRAELISTPSLFTANQQTASIEAGEEVPYQEVSESGGTAVVFKKAVLGLTVTPQILPGNKVMLELKINQDRPNNKMVLGMPTISTRQITSQVLIENGHTIVLGGIYEANQESGTEGIPFLNRLPIIGNVFQQHNKRHSKRELLIFVTPKLLPYEKQT